MDEQHPSTSQHLKNCNQESFIKEISKITNVTLLSSTDSENEKKSTTQRKHQHIEKSKIDTVIIFLCCIMY